MNKETKKIIGVISIIFLIIVLIILCLVVLLLWYDKSAREKRDKQINLEVKRITELVKTNESVLEDLCVYELSNKKNNSSGDRNIVKEEGEFQEGRDLLFKEMGFNDGKVYKNTNDRYILFNSTYLDTMIVLEYYEDSDVISSDYIYITDRFYIATYDLGHTYGG